MGSSFFFCLLSSFFLANKFKLTMRGTLSQSQRHLTGGRRSPRATSDTEEKFSESHEWASFIRDDSSNSSLLKLNDGVRRFNLFGSGLDLGPINSLTTEQRFKLRLLLKEGKTLLTSASVSRRVSRQIRDLIETAHKQLDTIDHLENTPELPHN